MGKIITITTSLLLFVLFASAQNIDEVAAIWKKVYQPVDSVGLGSRTVANDNIMLKELGGYWIDTRLPGNGIYNTIRMNLLVATGTVTAGTLFFEQSADTSSSANTYQWFVTDNITAASTTTYTLTTASRSFSGQLLSRFVRVRLGTAVTGTTTGVQMISTYSTTSAVPPSLTATSSYGPNLQVQAAINTGSFNNGTTVYTYTATASNNQTLLKASTGNIYTIHLTNYAAYACFFRLFNKATAPVTGTDANLYEWAIPANSSIDIPISDVGLKFATGIGFNITKLQAALDNTVLVAGDIQLTMAYN
jgi:hypothetical protein